MVTRERNIYSPAIIRLGSTPASRLPCNIRKLENILGRNSLWTDGFHSCCSLPVSPVGICCYSLLLIFTGDVLC